jgi:4-hydroxy-tetrahydrodipicolinate synthase
VFYRQLPLLQFILKGGLPTTVKAGLAILGYAAGAPRKPLQPLAEEDYARLKALLAELAN